MGARIQCVGGGVKGRYRNYLTLAGAAAAGQGFLFLLSPFVARLYTPAEFGGFGLMLGMSAIVASVGTGRLEHAIPVTKNRAQAVSVAVLGVLLILATSAVAATVVLGLGYVGALEGTAWDGLPLMLIPAAALALALFQLANALLLRTKDFPSVGGNRILQGGATGILQLAFGWLGIGAMGLMLAQTIGYMAGCAAGARGAFVRVVALARRRSMALKITLQRYKRYPLVMTPAALCNQASQQMPLVAIGYIYGLHEAGLYALVLRVCGGPLGLIGQAVGQVYAAEFRSLLEKDSREVGRQYRALLVRLFVTGVLVVAGLVFVLRISDQFLFGQNWSRLGDVAMYLSAMLVLDFATTPIATTLGYLERQRVQLYWDLFRLCTVSLVFAGAFAMSLEYETILLLHSTVWSLTLMIHAWLTYRACLSESNLGRDSSHL